MTTGKNDNDNERITMKLRFSVDQAECFRNGIDCPKSIVTIEVEPANLSDEERILIADRLIGIDVCSLWNSNDGTTKERGDFVEEYGRPIHIIAKRPDWGGLIAAIKENEEEVRSRRNQHRSLAFRMAWAGIDSVGELEKAITGVLPQKPEMRRIEQFVGAVKGGDAAVIKAQQLIRKMKSDGDSMKKIEKALHGTAFDGMDLNAFLAADTTEKRLNFVMLMAAK
jgi:hypothetical protein